LSSIPLLFGSPHPMVRITWRDVGPDERRDLEQRFRLTDSTELDDGDWLYSPTDTSPTMLRTIVTHSSVGDTDGIDRRALRISASPPLSPRQGGLVADAPAWIARTVKLLAYALMCLAATLVFRATFASPLPPPAGPRAALLALFSDPIRTLRALPSSARTLIEYGIPSASAGAAGLFRIVFGTAVLAFVWSSPVSLEPLQSYEVTVAQGAYGTLVRWLSSHPTVTHDLGRWLNVSGALFIVGLWTPVSFATFVGAFLVWVSIFTLQTSTHAVAALGITLMCLLPARWGDAWSVDALWRRVRGRSHMPAAGACYGYAFWIPRLVLGVAFLAAAWSKVGGGFDWILNGTVKYHFISDFNQAWVDWGPRLTQSHAVAVGMSAAAVAIEALVITAAFSRSTTHHLLCGAASLALFTGFALFQGVLWLGWWILLLAFLPWQLFRTSPRTSMDTLSLSGAQVAIVLTLVAQQSVASTFQVEARPLVSAYDMYSATYASPEEYENASNLVYRVVVFDNGQPRELPDCVVDDRTAGLVAAAAAGASGEREQLKHLLGRCLQTDVSTATFALEGDREVYNWNTRRFTWKRRLDVIGPFPVAWLGP